MKRCDFFKRVARGTAAAGVLGAPVSVQDELLEFASAIFKSRPQPTEKCRQRILGCS